MLNVKKDLISVSKNKMLYEQDKDLFNKILVDLENINEIFMSALDDAGMDDKNLTMKALESIALNIEKSEKSLILETSLKDIKNMLRDRYGFKVVLQNKPSIFKPIEVIKPQTDIFIINKTMSVLEHTFKKDNIKTISKLKTDKAAIGLANDIRRSIKNKKPMIVDMDNAFVKNAKSTVLYLNINFLWLKSMDVTSREILSFIIREIGMFILELNALSQMNKESLELTNNFMDSSSSKEIFAKEFGKDLNEINNNVHSQLYLINQTLQDINRGKDNLRDQSLDFLARYLLNNEYTKGIYIIESTTKTKKRYIHKDAEEQEKERIKNLLDYGLLVIMTALTLIFLGIVILLLPILLIGVGVYLAIVFFIRSLVKNLLLFFNDKLTTTNTALDMKIENLKKSKLAYVHLLRRDDISKEERVLLVSEITNINEALHLYGRVLFLKDVVKPYHKDIDTLVKELDNNELHYIEQKLKG